MIAREALAAFLDPPREFSLVPFWFWNDELNEDELLRQIDDFDQHGVFGFVIHPRVGLPRHLGWTSDALLSLMRVAVEEAARRAMLVVLYDEGMYPSGSSSGQVVARNPDHRPRGLECIALSSAEPPPLPWGHNLVAIVQRGTGAPVALVDRPVDGRVRGLHYIGEGPAEDEPPYADILNSAAVTSFIELVYERYAQTLGDHFGTTIRAIFTDEPQPMGRLAAHERTVLPGTVGILDYVNSFLGYDFTPHLPALWYDDEPQAAHYRATYARAILARTHETYYRPLQTWCHAHGLALAGHPAQPDELGTQRYFDIPGQDLVWRWVLPRTASALEGPESTQAKASSSAMLHLGRRRNSNECYGAYGHAFTWDEMKGLADWCFVRGVNMLLPHAFYYSVRGCRRDERPPDVGPHSPWWPDYRAFADYCRRLSWLNTATRHVCSVAILGLAERLPWSAARVCLESQRDFNYLEARHLWEDAAVDDAGVHLAGMHYAALILDDLTPPLEALPVLQCLARTGRLLHWAPQGEPAPADLAGLRTAHTPAELLAHLNALCPRDLQVYPAQPDLRYRHVCQGSLHYYLLSNEGSQALQCTLHAPVPGIYSWVDPFTAQVWPTEERPRLNLPPGKTRVLLVEQVLMAHWSSSRSISG